MNHFDTLLFVLSRSVWPLGTMLLFLVVGLWLGRVIWSSGIEELRYQVSERKELLARIDRIARLRAEAEAEAEAETEREIGDKWFEEENAPEKDDEGDEFDIEPAEGDRVEFSVDYDLSGAISESGISEIGRAVSEILDRGDAARVVVEGYSDSGGSEEFNDLLGRAWAQDVSDQLVDEGIDPRVITVNSRGVEKAAGEGDQIITARSDSVRCVDIIVTG